MKALLLKGALGAALALTGVASAGHHHPARTKLAIVPLPKAAIGPAAASLAVKYDSGSLSNEDAASESYGVVGPQQLKKLGRITGYVLGYGDAISGDTGVTQVVTGVDEYKTAADAKKGLAFWKKDDAKVTSLSAPTLAVTTKRLKLPAVGAAHYAYLTAFTVPTVNPIYDVVERLADGRFVLQIDVSASSPAAAKTLTPVLARKLDRRLRLMLAHRLKGKPVPIPFPPDDGPPPGGPDLSTLMITPGDIGQQTVVNLLQGYGTSPPAISGYSMLLSPAGPYDALIQEIDWYPSDTEATYAAAFDLAGFYAFAQLPVPGSQTQVEPVDVSAVGDNGQAALVPDVGFGEIVLRRGPVVDTVNLFAQTLAASNLQDVAHLAAARLDPGIPG